MQFEIEGVVFNTNIYKDNNEYTITASTETPFCRDIIYAATIDEDVDELTAALKTKAVIGSYDDETGQRLTLLYGDKTLNLYFDDDYPDVPSDFITKLKNYYTLTKDMLELRKAFEKLQATCNDLTSS